MVPYRVKRLVNDRLPLVYYAVNKLRFNVNDPSYWDLELERSWDDPKRAWPTKVERIMQHARATDAILDVGCGTGSMLRALQGLGYRNLHGLDGSHYACDRLTRSGITMTQAVLPSIPLPEMAFDVVVASEVLEHIVRRSRFLRELLRVTKPGGTLILFVPNNCMGPMIEKEHVRTYTRETLSRFVGTRADIIECEGLQDRNHDLPSLMCVARRRPE